MLKRLPIEIDPFRLVEQRMLLEGTLLIKHFSRLEGLLASDAGELHVSLAFDRTPIRRLPMITGHLSGELQLICQRCLAAISHSIDHEIKLVLVKTDAEAERLQHEFETWWVENNSLFMQDFIEDEVLLGLPHSALHRVCEPFKPLIEALPEAVEMQEDKKNPFAVLKDLQQ